jgi:hypothetical protein
METGLPRCIPLRQDLRISRRVCSRARCQPWRFMAWCILLPLYAEKFFRVHDMQAGDDLFVADLAVGCAGLLRASVAREVRTRDSCPQDTTDELDPRTDRDDCR